MRRTVRSLILATSSLFIATLASPAHAYRPFDSTDADVADYGEVELEMGPVGLLRSHSVNRFEPIQVLNLGFARDWELVLQGRESLPSENPVKSRITIGDTGLFLKHVLREGTLQGARGVSVATEFGVLLPGFHEDEPGAGFSIALIASQRFSFGTLHLNAQVAETKAGNRDVFGGFIAEGPFDWRVRPVLELLADHELDDHSTLSVLGGVIVRITSEFNLDAGLRLADSDNAGVVEFRGGFTWTLPAWH